jgi:hypothetical protein
MTGKDPLTEMVADRARVAMWSIARPTILVDLPNFFSMTCSEGVAKS